MVARSSVWRRSGCHVLPFCTSSGIPVVAPRRRNPARAGPVRHIGVAMVELPAESDVLAGHVVVGRGNVPGFERVSRILREIGRARGSGRAIDRWQQHQIASRVIDLSATQREPVAVFVEPPAVVNHKAEETLLVGHDLARGVFLIGSRRLRRRHSRSPRRRDE